MIGIYPPLEWLSELAARVHHAPSALDRIGEIAAAAAGKEIAVFLDYDGALAPMAERPELAVLSPSLRETLRRLARYSTVAVLSGRDLEDLRRRVGVPRIFYVGNHGLELLTPAGKRIAQERLQEIRPLLRAAEQALFLKTSHIPGVRVEPKRFSTAVHYRQVRGAEIGAVERAVDEVLMQYPELRKVYGKRVFEVRPAAGGDKGRAVLAILDALDVDRPRLVPFYVGDDETNESAFRALQPRGIGIAVQDEPRSTAAGYTLQDPEEVERLLRLLSSFVGY
jgi:trehalose-phosphatase